MPDSDAELRVGLFGEGSSGQTYRLRDAVFVVDGPTQANLSSEDLDQPTTPLAAVVTEGDYSVDLQDGWRVERQGANTTWQDVDATLASENPALASVSAQSTTTVTYTFSIDGEAVPFDQGTLEIDVDFSDTDAPCPDENNDGFCDACGDLEITSGEECDGSNLAGSDCSSLGFVSGQLSCTPSCLLDTSGCSNCGNGIIDPGEECDGSNLAGESCSSLGFVSGQLSCTSSCLFGTSGCSNCGNGIIDPGEDCEPPNSVIAVNNCGQLCFQVDSCTSTCQLFEEPCACS